MKEDLNSRTKKFAISVIFLVKKMPSTIEYQVINKQLIRSATSVAANTRASFKARSKKEYLAKLGVVIEEADESLF